MALGKADAVRYSVGTVVRIAADHPYPPARNLVGEILEHYTELGMVKVATPSLDWDDSDGTDGPCWDGPLGWIWCWPSQLGVVR